MGAKTLVSWASPATKAVSGNDCLRRNRACNYKYEAIFNYCIFLQRMVQQWIYGLSPGNQEAGSRLARDFGCAGA